MTWRAWPSPWAVWDCGSAFRTSTVVFCGSWINVWCKERHSEVEGEIVNTLTSNEEGLHVSACVDCRNRVLHIDIAASERHDVTRGHRIATAHGCWFPVGWQDDWFFSGGFRPRFADAKKTHVRRQGKLWVGLRFSSLPVSFCHPLESKLLRVLSFHALSPTSVDKFHTCAADAAVLLTVATIVIWFVCWRGCLNVAVVFSQERCCQSLQRSQSLRVVPTIAQSGSPTPRSRYKRLSILYGAQIAVDMNGHSRPSWWDRPSIVRSCERRSIVWCSDATDVTARMWTCAMGEIVAQNRRSMGPRDPRLVYRLIKIKTSSYSFVWKSLPVAHGFGGEARF